MDNSAINLQMIKLPLTLEPLQTRRVNFGGSFISILTNSLTLDPIVSADSGTSTALPAGVGLPAMRLSADGTTLIPAVFRYVEFHNPSMDEYMQITFSIAMGTPIDTRAVVSGYLQMDLSAPAIASPVALAVETDAHTVLASNLLVKERLVQNNGDYPIWWGGANVDPATKCGLCIMPGGSAVINCWGAIYFMAEEAASVLSVVNILKTV